MFKLILAFSIFFSTICYYSWKPGAVDSGMDVLEIARGKKRGISHINKFGKSGGFFKENVEGEVWLGGPTFRKVLTHADNFAIVSNSAEDNVEGAGAHRVKLLGLDKDYKQISEIVNLNGTSVVHTKQKFLRIYRAFLVKAGSSNVNMGDIDMYPVKEGISHLQVHLIKGLGQTFLSQYTIPKGKTGYLIDVNVSSNVPSIIKLIINAQNGPYRILKMFDINNQSIDMEHEVPSKFEEKTDIKWMAISTDNRARIYVQYTIILVDN